MQLESHIQAIQQELAAAAALGDEATADAARRMGDALRRRSTSTCSTSSARPPSRSAARSSRAGSRFDSPGAIPSSSSSPTNRRTPSQVGVGEESSGRITLRLPESLKAAVEAAAAREGVSTNAWLVRSIARTLEHRPSKKSRNRMQGYVQG